MAHVLRLSRIDAESSFVLVYVDTNGSRPLDLRLIGTEGSAPFVLSLKHSRIASFRAKNSPCTADGWGTILDSILHQKTVDASNREVLKDVEAMASVEEGISITITFRKRISGITQRLGSLLLAHAEDQEIELYDWCGLVIQATNSVTNKLASLEEKFRAQEDASKKLHVQIQELIEAKTNHENELLEKFRDLLNEKKAKIRNQQRLLATATMDPKKLSAVKISGNGNSRAAGKSRTAKRKSAGKIPEVDEEDDFETMELDDAKVEKDSEQEEAQTSEDETADEDEAETLVPPERQVTVPEPRTQSEGAKTPPRRELPFAKKRTAIPAKPADDGDETESDDEL